MQARELKPRFIALAGSPIPYMNGTDFPALDRSAGTGLGFLHFCTDQWYARIMYMVQD